MLTDRQKERAEGLKEYFAKLLSFDKNLEVTACEPDEHYGFWLTVNVDTGLTDEDFDFEVIEADEDGPGYTKTSFGTENLSERASDYLYKVITNSGLFKLEEHKRGSRSYGTYPNTHFYRYISQTWKVSNSYYKIMLNMDWSSAIFDTDEEELEKSLEGKPEPTITCHYYKGSVRGVMDADPDEYDCEISMESMKIPLLIHVAG